MAGPSNSATVVVEPKRLTYEAAPDETLMGAALRSGLRWPTLCGGDGLCTVCYVRVIEGADHLGGMSEREKRTLKGLMLRYPDIAPGELRLACQAVVEGDVTVLKRGVR